MTEQKHTGIIEEAVVKSGETNNKPWKRSVIKVSGKTFSSFDKDLAEDIFNGRIKKDMNVEIDYKTDGKYNTLLTITPSSIPINTQNTQFQTADKVISDRMSKDDWMSKDARIIRQNTLNRGVELVIADKIKIDDVYAWAESMEQWVWKARQIEHKEIQEKEIEEQPM
jgi:hypothetical protein